MTREEAKQVLENELKANCKICMHPQEVGYCEHTCTYREAMETAISALQAEPSVSIQPKTIANNCDLISRADAIEAVASRDSTDGHTLRFAGREITDLLSALPSAEAVHKPDYSYEADMVMRLREYEHGWIPFTRRPMTEEEQDDYPDCTFIFDCVLPDDGDEILVSNGRFVWMDTFCVDDGCYLDGGDDIDEDMAWMPLPTPYRGGDSE